MDIGIIGLGRMGGNIARRLARGGHRCIGYDRNSAAVAGLAKDGSEGAADLADLIAKLPAPRDRLGHAAGRADHRGRRSPKLRALLERRRHHHRWRQHLSTRTTSAAPRRSPKTASDYVDVGTSGGVWGLERGYCLMIGGEAEIVRPSRSDLRDARARQGRRSRATPGRERPRPARRAGLSSIAGPGRLRPFRQDDPQRHRIRPDAGLCRGLRHPEGKAVPRACRKTSASTLDLADIAEVWRRGSVVSSWLLDLCAIALAQRPGARRHSAARVADSGEGRWTIEAAIEEAVPADVLSTALFARFRSRQDHTFGEKLLSAMRSQVRRPRRRPRRRLTRA